MMNIPKEVDKIELERLKGQIGINREQKDKPILFTKTRIAMIGALLVGALFDFVMTFRVSGNEMKIVLLTMCITFLLVAVSFFIQLMKW